MQEGFIFCPPPSRNAPSSIHTEEFLKQWCMITSASFNYNQKEVSASSCGTTRVWRSTIELISFGWKELSVAFPFFFFCSLLLKNSSLWKNVHRSPFMGSVKGSLNVSIGMDEHVNRSLAEQEDSAQSRLDLWIYILQAPQCTWPAGVKDGGGEVLALTTRFFLSFLTSSHHSRSLRGAERSHWSLSSGSGLATRSSGLQENSYSLWHMLRRSIIPLFRILSSPVLSCQICLHRDL